MRPPPAECGALCKGIAALLSLRASSPSTMDFDLDAMEREILSAADFYLAGGGEAVLEEHPLRSSAHSPATTPGRLGQQQGPHEGRPPSLEDVDGLLREARVAHAEAAPLTLGEDDDGGDVEEAELFFAADLLRPRSISLAPAPALGGPPAERSSPASEDEYIMATQAAAARIASVEPAGVGTSAASPYAPSTTLSERGKVDRTWGVPTAAASRHRTDLHAAREAQRAAREEEEAAECTFQPDLSRTQRARRPKPDPVATSERLFHDADEREVLRLCARYNLEEEEMAQYTFQPAIDGQSAKMAERDGYRPIHERTSDVQRDKAMRMNARLEDPERQHPFKPHIDPKSERLAARRRDGALPPVAQRLEAEARAARERKERAIAQRERELSREAPFQPHLQTSRAKVRRDASEVLNLPFHERQAALEMKRQQRASQRRARSARAEETWFQPDVNARSARILAKKQNSRLYETPQDKVHRLAIADAERRAAYRTAAAEEKMAEMSFQPTIDPVSKRLAPSTTDAEKSINFRGRRTRMHAEQKAQVRFLQQHSFHPTLATPQSSRDAMTPRKGAIEASQEYPERRKSFEERRRQLRAEKELEEMRECTWTPKVNKRRPQQQKPVVVRGLGRHLELREMAKRKDEEQQERERRAFGTASTGGRNAVGITIAKPFRLSSSNANRKQRARKDHEKRFQEECTFEPVTLERVNREAIIALLQDA